MIAATTILLLAATPLLPPLVEEHCFSCHGEDKVEAEFDLRLPLHPAAWRRAIAQVEREEMPPHASHLSEAGRQEILTWLEKSARSAPPAPRPPVPRYVRLTQEEYNRSVAAVLGLDLRPGDLLEADPQGITGFTNDAESLQISPAQAAKYLEAAERAIEGWSALKRPGITVHFEAEAMDRSSSHIKEFDHGILFATEPQVISASVEIPVDGYYEIRCHGSTMGKPTRLQVLDGPEPITSVPVTHPRPGATTHRIPILLRKGWHTLSVNQLSLVPQASLPRDADRVMNERAARNRMQVPELPPGATPAQIEARRTLEEKCLYLQQAFEWLYAYGEHGDPRDIVRFRDYATERIEGERQARHWYASEILQTDVAVFERDWEARNGAILQRYQEHLAKIADIKWMDWTKYQGQLYLDWIEVAGPIQPAGKILDSGTELRTVAERAWRGRVDAEELALYEQLPRDLALAALFTSPRFVFRDNADPAVRLSYFLHGAPPDAQLRQARWDKPDQVKKSIRRLLAAPAFAEALDNFTGQWLGTAPLGVSVMPDEYRFPGYKRHVALAARREPVEFFLRLVREKRSLRELLDSEWTMIDTALAEFYGLASPSRGGWQPVELPDSRRGGLLGMSAVLATTSSPLRTTPVARGKWVWETLLGRNPGIPVPDAGVLPATAGEEGLSLREELEAHRSVPRCLRCHEKLDPIGLSLENFDAVGAWRDTAAGKPIDATGKFFRGAEFSGPEGLRSELLLREDEFLTQLIRKLLAYAHGRPCDDETAWIDQIAARVKAERWSAAALFEEVAINLVENGPVP